MFFVFLKSSANKGAEIVAPTSVAADAFKNCLREFILISFNVYNLHKEKAIHKMLELLVYTDNPIIYIRHSSTIKDRGDAESQRIITLLCGSAPRRLIFFV